MTKVAYAVRTAVATLALSTLGIGALQKEEGYSNRVYLDSIGKPTVCTGHMDTAMKVGKLYSDAECAELLRKDTASVHAFLVRSVKVPLYQYEYDALLLLCFNIGTGNCASSTLFKLLNRGEYELVADQFLRWRFAGGLDCKVRTNNCYGVYLRRYTERDIWKGAY